QKWDNINRLKMNTLIRILAHAFALGAYAVFDTPMPTPMWCRIMRLCSHRSCWLSRYQTFQLQCADSAHVCRFWLNNGANFYQTTKTLRSCQTYATKPSKYTLDRRLIPPPFPALFPSTKPHRFLSAIPNTGRTCLR